MIEPQPTPSFPSRERWEVLEPLLDAALALPEKRRAAFLDEISAGDAVLRQELMQMIAACEHLAHDGSLLEQPAAARFLSLWEEPDDPLRLQEALAGRYTLEGEAGRGGMAIVYRARDLRHKRPVALKVLHAVLRDRSPSRFRREIALSAGLQHPHILPVFDSGESAGRLWYTMPFVDGESLGERLRRETRLELGEGVRLLREIAGALDYAHARGIVHRDLKPDNVLLSGGHAVIADFGVAKALGGAAQDNPRESNPDDRTTGAGVTVGTPAYMAPEQITADPGADHRIDLYALGVIAYRLFAGVPPFAGTSRQALFAAHLAARPVPVTAHRSDVPVALERLIMQLLEKRPADRPPSANEVLVALEVLETSLRDTRPLPPVTTPPLRPPAPWRRSFRIVGALMVAGVVAAGAIAWGIRARQPPASTRRVLVVPFENASGDTSIAYVGRAAAEWIAQGLARSGYADVVSDLVTPGVHAPTDVAAAAAASGASLVVSGTYFVIGDSIRMQLRVSDLVTRTLLPGSAPIVALRTTPLALLEPLGNQVVVMLATRH